MTYNSIAFLSFVLCIATVSGRSRACVSVSEDRCTTRRGSRTALWTGYYPTGIWTVAFFMVCTREQAMYTHVHI